jgi:hypothetical protein
LIDVSNKIVYPLSEMNFGRYAHSSISFNNHVYVFGGKIKGDNLNKIRFEDVIERIIINTDHIQSLNDPKHSPKWETIYI